MASSIINPNKPSLISEERKKDILERLKEERESRKNLIAVGSSEPYLDKNLIKEPNKQDVQFRLEKWEKEQLLDKIFKERRKPNTLKQESSAGNEGAKAIFKSKENVARDSIEPTEENWESLVNRDYLFESGEKSSQRTPELSSERKNPLQPSDSGKPLSRLDPSQPQKNFPGKALAKKHDNASSKNNAPRPARNENQSKTISNKQSSVNKENTDNLKSIKAKLLNSFEKKVRDVCNQTNIDKSWTEKSPDVSRKTINWRNDYSPSFVNRHAQSQRGEKTRARSGFSLEEDLLGPRRKSFDLFDYKEQFNFKPSTNPLPKHIYGDRELSKLEISKEEIWRRLLKSKREEIECRERRRIDLETEQVNKTCTFQPEINKSLKNLSTTIISEGSVAERLYNEGKDRQNLKDRLKREFNDQQVYPFQPQIDASSRRYLKGDKAEERPIHERVYEIVKGKQELLQKLKMESEVAQNLTYQPQINEKSVKIAQMKKEKEGTESVTDRLVKDANDKIYKKIKQFEEYQSEMNQICTFTPAINPISKSNDELLENNPNFKFHKDFVTRQYFLAENLKEKLDKITEEVRAEERCTFKPEINPISKYIVQSDPNKNEEKLGEKIERLSKKDLEKKEMLQEQINKAYYEKFTFKPEINPISKTIGKTHTIETLADIKERNEHLKSLQEEEERKMKQELTFKPQINKKKEYNKVQPKYSKNAIRENIEKEKFEKEKKIEDLKKVKEYEEIKECSFRPKVNSQKENKPVSNNKSVEVKGLEKFLEHKERQKKLIQEKKEREEKVFHLEKNYKYEEHETHTVPKPFGLSKNNPNNLKMIREEVLEKEKKTCTFKPTTNEGKRKKILEKILQKSTDSIET